MPSLRLGEISVHYDEEGSGDPLLLVHGHPFNRSMWAPQLSHFGRRGWRVIAPDLRGYGQSTVVPGKTLLATFARDLVALLDRLGVEQTVVAGLSMGGQIVLELYRLFPERPRGLVLADTFAQAETEDGKRARREVADRLVREGMAGYAEEVLPKMVALHNLPGSEVPAKVLRMMRESPPEGAAAALRGRAERPDYVEMLPRIAVPTLVVVGTEDAFTPVRDARFLHERIPGASLELIEGAGHLPNLERPGEFNAALERFLTAIPRTAPLG